jgi:hypothetical protein
MYREASAEVVVGAGSKKIVANGVRDFHGAMISSADTGGKALV